MSCHPIAFRTVARSAALGVVFAVQPLSSGLAAPKDALDVCRTIEHPDVPGADPSEIDPQFLNPDIRVKAQDFSGRDLAGENFRGKVLIDVKFKGANLQRADFTEAIICANDLTNANLTAAHLDRALIGGATILKSANFTNASARALNIADASGDIRIDGTDLRAARIMCDPDEVRCLGENVEFISMAGADLRGATISHLCCASPGLSTAKLDGVTTQFNGYTPMDFAPLAAGIRKAGRITFIPDYGISAVKTEFTGTELGKLSALVGQMRSESAHPSFDCSRARSAVEKAICTEPRLAALDSGMNWLWRGVEHTPQEISAQREWLTARGNCPPPPSHWIEFWVAPFISPADPQGCIAFAYLERIRQLAPKSSQIAPGSGTYTTDEPLELPKGKTSTLAEKFLMARGLREDEISVANLENSAGKISGSGVWTNGHLCSLDASQVEIKRTGAQFQIFDVPTARDEYSISFAVTPQVVVRVGGARQFQCGARGGWSDAYFRQPDNLVSKVKRLQGSQ
jgi:uncharacterized protein YjbI with pentapeptide repeats